MADRPHPEPDEHRTLGSSRRARLGPVALGLGSAATLAALGVLVWSGVTTASARIAGSTDSDGSLLQAATIALEPGDGTGDGGGSDSGGNGALRAELLVDADGLYPGLVVERCLPVRYQGSLDDVPLVLSARITGGTGLERYLDTAVTVGRGTDPACTDFAPGPGDGAGTATTADVTADRFVGTLAGLSSAHGRYEQGLTLAPLGDGDEVTVRFRFEVRPDDGAQGRSTGVHLRFEVRP